MNAVRSGCDICETYKGGTPTVLVFRMISRIVSWRGKIRVFSKQERARHTPFSRDAIKGGLGSRQ